MKEILKVTQHFRDEIKFYRFNCLKICKDGYYLISIYIYINILIKRT